METYLNTSDVAKMCGVSASWLNKARSMPQQYGYGPVYLKLGRRVLYRRSDVEKWLESKLVTPDQQ